MRKSTRLVVLLGVLLVICGAAFAVSGYQEKQENIKNSGQVVLEIPTDSVTALSWTNESGSFSFTKGDTWTYDGDAAFPVSEEKIENLLSQFESFAAAFVIEDVEDYSQYGLDDPVCTIQVTAGEESYTVTLGNFSKMDEQRYVSIGDGKAYLAVQDPMDGFDAVLRDMILDDTVPDFHRAEEIQFTGTENYTILRDEEGKSICQEDVYFADGKPLDTDNVDAFLDAVRNLDLSDYVSYNVTEQELSDFGLTDPNLTIRLTYSTEDGDERQTGELTLHLSQNPEEAKAYKEAKEKDEEDLPEVTCYARLGQSQIVYEITQSEYDKLTAVSYNALRHQKLFTADFDTVTSIDVTLNGETSTFTYTTAEKKEDEGTWTYGEEEFDIQDLKAALCAISASDFTDQAPTGQEEISLTVTLDNEDFPTFTLTLRRYDGTNCLALVDQKPVAYVSRSQTVALIEAVNKLVLGS